MAFRPGLGVIIRTIVEAIVLVLGVVKEAEEESFSPNIKRIKRIDKCLSVLMKMLPSEEEEKTEAPVEGDKASGDK